MNYIKKIKIVTILIILISTLPAKTETYNAKTTLAEVNEKKITLGHVIAAVARLPKEYVDLEPSYLLEGILDQIVKQEVMAQSLDISENQIKISLENEIRSLKAKYAVEKKMRGFPDPQIIQNAYNETISSAENIEEFNASHILVESEEKALEILQLLDAGVEFSKLAQEESSGPSGPNGGKLGWFGLGQMVPKFETAVMVLEIGKVSQPVKTEFGWHVIKLNDRRLKPIPTLEELRPELVQKLTQEQINKIVENASSEATIQMFNSNIDASSILDIDLLSSNE